MKPVGDFLAGQAFENHFQHLLLPARELFERVMQSNRVLVDPG